MRKDARWESRGWTATWSTREILFWPWHSAQSVKRNETLSAHRTEIYYLILWVSIRRHSSMAWLLFLVYADVELSEFCKQKNSVKYFHSPLVICVGLILFFRFIIIQPIFCFALFKLHSQTAEKTWLIKYSTRRCFQSQHSSLCWHLQVRAILSDLHAANVPISQSKSRPPVEESKSRTGNTMDDTAASGPAWRHCSQSRV